MDNEAENGPHDWRLKIRQSARVEGLIPEGFESYRRIFHKAAKIDSSGSEGPVPRPVGWAAVALALNQKLESNTVWRDLSGTYGEPAIVPDVGTFNPPDEGRLDAAGFSALARLLASSGDGPFHAAFWNGWGSLTDAFDSGQGVRKYVPESIGDLDYYVCSLDREELAGSSWMQARELGWLSGYGLTPTYLWPADFSWFLTTDVDMDSSILAGPASLLNRVSDLPELESLPVKRSTDLTASTSH